MCNFQPFEEFNWQLAQGKSLILGKTARIMGVLNVTPDSFSDGGKFDGIDRAIEQALMMVDEGADIIDIGGESTRPGALEVSKEVEQSRVLPVIEALAGQSNVLISVDTYRSETAKMAIEAGAHIINDVWGFQKDPELANIAVRLNAGVCAMHTGRDRVKNNDVIKDQVDFLSRSLNVLIDAGVHRSSIVLDPGFGFAKDPAENVQLLNRLEAVFELGQPLLIGTSRKRFVGHYSGRDTENRDVATAATSAIARLKGGAIFRVHDVAKNRDALKMADAVLFEGKI